LIEKRNLLNARIESDPKFRFLRLSSCSKLTSAEMMRFVHEIGSAQLGSRIKSGGHMRRYIRAVISHDESSSSNPLAF
jgi:hypothetical protein